MRWTLIPLAAALLAGCPEPDEHTDDTDMHDTDEMMTTVSFADDVWPVLEANCSGCHADDTWHPGYKLSDAATAYDALLNDAPTEDTHGFTNYVVPGDLDASLLYNKITEDPPATGQRMPLDGATGEPGAPLSDADIATIATWIGEGAHDN